ncbi:MAG: flagellar hook-basal body protein [Firmicutes bacterium]|nr:flagellar hook-basal body protein [Bacillota bacterium]
MLRGISNAASALKAQQLKLDITANNVANLNSTAFKKKEVQFKDLLYQDIAKRGNAVLPGTEKPVTAGTGTAMSAIRTDTRDGLLQTTGRELDFAIIGPGYFCVLMPDGTEAYTRAGEFQRDREGYLVTPQGYRVQFPQLPAEEQELRISEDGIITATTPTGEVTILGQVMLAYFNNPAGLVHLGGNLYAASPASGAPQIAQPGPHTRIKQFALESANVDLVSEMTNMILSQRNFSLNARALQTLDEMLQTANNIRR